MGRDLSFYVQARDATYGRHRIAGMTGSGGLADSLMAINKIRTVSEPVPGDFMIDRLAIYVSGAASGAKGRIGIYNCVNDLTGNLYPDELIYGSDELLLNTTGLKSVTTEIELPPNHLYWFACLTGVAAPDLKACPRGSVYPRLGIGSSWGNDVGVGWEAAYSYAALPATFPAGASIFTAAATIPAIAYARAE